MKSTGNGTPKVCTENLLKTFRGEVPFERVKGINPRLIDKPFPEVEADLLEDASWLIETYEPRVTLNGVTVRQDNAAGGNFAIVADTTETEV